MEPLFISFVKKNIFFKNTVNKMVVDFVCDQNEARKYPIDFGAPIMKVKK